MDQGIAAVWAGVAGLVGAGVGGCAAVWGATIGGNRAVEAAERAARHQSNADFQQWQRQERSEAYRELAALGHEIMAVLTTAVPEEEWTALGERMMMSMTRVRLAGPHEANEAASTLAGALLHVTVIQAGTPAFQTLVRINPTPKFHAFAQAYSAFVRVATQTLGQPPE